MISTIVVLCGGYGTRLYPVTQYLPKSLYPVCGKPFIDYQLCRFKEMGIEHVILCVGVMASAVHDYVGYGTKYGLRVEYAFDKTYGWGWEKALHNAKRYLPEEFFLTYGDSYLTADYGVVENEFHKQKKPSLMTIYKNNNEQMHKNNIGYDEINHQLWYYGNEKTSLQYVDYGLKIFKKSYILDKIESMWYDTSCNIVDPILYAIQKNEMGAAVIKERFYEIGSQKGIVDFTKYVIKKGIYEF